MSRLALIFHDILTWRAALDIFLIAAGLFFLYRTLVRQGTWKILLGIFAAFLIFVFANALHLEGTTWIFQNVSQVAVLALIVIFQPELRKVLEKIVSVKRSSDIPLNQNLPDIVASSLWDLARQKRGALIVFPGKELLDEKITGGHSLLAEPSIPLIMSIFDPNSPGHDGAVIIWENKLSKFGVRLPMSQTTRLAEDFGTRHHAAMGLAEATDALVLVVSEERGVVSAFHNGTMERMDSISHIVTRIRDHQQRHGFFEKEIDAIMDRRSALQVLVSLIIATLFWTGLATANRQVIERTVTLEVDYQSLPEGLLITGDRVDEVRIKIIGPKAEVDEYVINAPEIKIDLSQMIEGRQTILVSEDDLNLKGKIALVEIVPPQLEVILASVTKKNIPVIPQLVGSLPPKLNLIKISVIPESIPAYAPPPKRGEKPLQLSTTPVYLNSIQGDTRIFCKIIAPPTIQPQFRPWQDVEIAIDVEPFN